MCQLTQCCGCVPLKKGTLIIGGLDLILSILSVFVLITKALMYSIQQQQNEDAREAPQWLKATFFSLLVYHILHAAIATLLIAGVNKGKAKYMVPWLVLKSVTIVLVTAGMIGGTICMSFMMLPGSQVTYAVATIWGIFLVSIAISIHLIMVVDSQYKSMKSPTPHPGSSQAVEMDTY